MTDTTSAGAPAPAPAPALPSFLKAAVSVLLQHGLTALGFWLLATHRISSQTQIDQLAGLLGPIATTGAGVAWSLLMQRRWFSHLVAALNAAPPLTPVLDAIFPPRPKAPGQSVTVAFDVSELVAEIRALAAKIDAQTAPIAIGATTVTVTAAEAPAPDPVPAAAAAA